MNEQMKKMYE